MSIDQLSADRIRQLKADITGLNREYSDLNLKFRVHPEYGDVVPLKEENAIKNSVKNILMTSKGERPFKPWLGSNLKKYLFELADPITMEAMREEIIYSISEQEPRVIVDDVVILNDPDDNAYYITVKVTLQSIKRNVEIELYLERTR